MKITAIQLILNRQPGPAHGTTKVTIMLPVEIPLIQSRKEPDRHNVDTDIRITIDHAAFEKYGKVAYHHYGMVKRRAKRLPGITGTEIKISITFRVKGYILTTGEVYVNFGLLDRTVSCLPTESIEFEVNELMTTASVIDIEYD